MANGFMEVRILLFGSEADMERGKSEFGLTTEQVAAHLKLSVARLRQLVAQGEIRPCAHIGRIDVYRETEVEALRKKREG